MKKVSHGKRRGVLAETLLRTLRERFDVAAGERIGLGVSG